MRSENDLLHTPVRQSHPTTWPKVSNCLFEAYDADSRSNRLNSPQRRAAGKLRERVNEWNEDAKNQDSNESKVQQYQNEIDRISQYEFEAVLPYPEMKHLTDYEQEDATAIVKKLQEALDEKVQLHKQMNMKRIASAVGAIRGYEYDITYRADFRFAGNKAMSVMDERYQKYDRTSRKRSYEERTRDDFERNTYDRGSPNGPSAKVRYCMQFFDFGASLNGLTAFNQLTRILSHLSI